MSMRVGRAWADAAADILAAPDRQACERLFGAAAAGFSVVAFFSGEYDLEALERTASYSICWPESFRRLYLSLKTILRDPLVEALRNQSKPFTWRELGAADRWRKASPRIGRYFVEHGWTDGLVVPIPRSERRVGMVSLVCRRHVISDSEKPLLTLLSTCFHERMRNLVSTYGMELAPVRLTKREIDILRLIATGSTDRGIATRLGISPATAHGHFENAKRKLKVTTRAEAAALAVSLGVVTP